MKSFQPPIAITMGDPAGISGEITIKAWLDLHRCSKHSFFVIDDPIRLKTVAKNLNIDIPLRRIDRAETAREVFTDALPILLEELNDDVTPGVPSCANALNVISSIDRAVEAVMLGDASAVVTNPVHKATLYESGFSSPGHTEHLAELTGVQTPPVMMLITKLLRVVPVTIHLSLQEAINTLSTDKIVECIRTTNTALRTDFGIEQPKFALAGLNPHAGEGGYLGREEIEIINPAINLLLDQKINVKGPFAPDTIFHADFSKNFDVIICMYHDQALIPSKILDFNGGVNITLGLPIIRTSPDHGTAFDIAGSGKADPHSLINAIQFAWEMAENKKNRTDNIVVTQK